MPTVFDARHMADTHKNIPPNSPKPKLTRPLRHDPITLFTAYAEYPEGLRFETQQEEEKVIVFMRQHFIVNVPWIAATILLLLAPFTILPFFFHLVAFPIALPPTYGVVGVLFWYVATFGYILYNFLHWYFNIYIVTTERIIDIDFIQLLYKKFSEARLDRIEDVTYTAGGFFAALFNFGNIRIQTAGESPEFEFESIPRPADVVAIMEGLIDKKGSANEPI